jgi:hypothetical protein
MYYLALRTLKSFVNYKVNNVINRNKLQFSKSCSRSTTSGSTELEAPLAEPHNIITYRQEPRHLHRACTYVLPSVTANPLPLPYTKCLFSCFMPHVLHFWITILGKTNILCSCCIRHKVC